MFCVECGSEDQIFRDGVCKNCYVKTHTFTSGPDIIDLPFCVNCNSYKLKNTWINELLGDALRRLVKNTFKISRELEKVDINTKCKEVKDGLACQVFISSLLDNLEINEEHSIHVRLKRGVCDVCSKQSGGYYEAIVQIRADKKKLTRNELDDICKFVENLVENLQEKGNRSLFIADMWEGHGGLDFYISERSPGLVIAKKLQERYGGTIKQSSKEVGVKEGKQMFRMTYLIRISPYKKGDFLKHNDMFFHILSTYGNKAKIVDLSNWEKAAVDIKEIEESRILGGEELIVEMILVSQTKEEVQVMDPKTYEIEILRKPKPVDFKKEKIKVLKTDSQTYILSTNT